MVNLRVKEVNEDTFRIVAHDLLWRKNKKKISKDKVALLVEEMCESGRKSWRDLADVFEGK